MDCGVKKVCEGLKHRMVRASSTIRGCFSKWVECTAPTNGNRKNSNKKKKRKTREDGGKKKKKKKKKRKNIKTRSQSTIDSLSVRIFVKNEQQREGKKKAVHTDISMCLYLILCLSSERCYCRHPKSELLLLPPRSVGLPLERTGEGGGEMMMKKKKAKENLSSINKKQNMCTVHCKRSFLYLISLRSGVQKENNTTLGRERTSEHKKRPFFRQAREWERFALERFV